MNQTQVPASYVYQLAFESFQFGKASSLSLVVLAFTPVFAAGYHRYQKVS